MIKELICIILLSVCFSFSCQSQAIENNERYTIDFEFKEGIYLSFEEFRRNQPNIKDGYKIQGNRLLVLDSSLNWIEVDPLKIWGYCTENNIYVSYEEAYWKLVNIGKLCQFSAITISRALINDAYGFQREIKSKEFGTYFFDFDDGLIQKLNAKNLTPYYKELNHKSSRGLGKKKDREQILFIKKYNYAKPIYFSKQE